jgi:hypothetical protein
LLQDARPFYRQFDGPNTKLQSATQGGRLPLEAFEMRHPALRRSARHSGKRGPRDGEQKAGGPPLQPDHTPPDPAAQNRPAPGVPPDGEHNQGGARAEGLDYQRDLGSEQDA